MRFLIPLAISVALLGASPVYSADPQPFPDFTFKRSKPPKAGTKKFITIQIEPQPDLPRTTSTQDTGASSVAPALPASSYAWYWTKVSPSLSDNSANRLRLAFDSLSGGPGGASVKGPRLQTIQGIAQAQGANILRATIGTKVSPALVLAVISVESGGKTAALSDKGAQGLMQLMPATAERFGVTDSLSSGQNIKGGVAYLNWLLDEFDGDAVMALAGYNAGENAVKKHEGVPPYAETRDYVPKVLAAFQVARNLCKTRPELVTDACALDLVTN